MNNDNNAKSPGVKIKFGIYEHPKVHDNKTIPCIWDSSAVINSHFLVCGKSGAGKSYTLRKMVHSLASQGVRCHIFDVHGDLEIPGLKESLAMFSQKTKTGVNPLEINLDEHTGGVNSTINRFLELLEITDRSLGPRQKRIIRHLLMELYEKRGIFEHDTTSWKRLRINTQIRDDLIRQGNFRELRKYYPTLDDLVNLTRSKIRILFIGNGMNVHEESANKAFKEFQKVAKMSGQLRRHMESKRFSETDEDRIKAQKGIEKCQEEAIAAFEKALKGANESTLNDAQTFTKKEDLESVLTRFENLQATGLFSSNYPTVDWQAPVWRYHIKYLSSSEQKIIVYYLMEKLFKKSMEEGETDRLRDVIIVDEAHKFISVGEDNIFQIIAREARKFGLGLICSSQSPEHFGKDFVTTVATKVLLGVDTTFYDQVSRSWNINRKVLEYITPHKSIAVFMDKKGMKNPSFKGVLVNE